MCEQDWPMLLNAQARSAQTNPKFCAVRGLTRSKFCAEHAKQSTAKSVVPIVVEASELWITLQLRKPIVIAGSASDLAQSAAGLWKARSLSWA